MSTSRTAPRLRADAQRNRDRLLVAARDAFGAATAGAPPSTEAIARAAGVGIGTLYRHFPTREALVEAVYRAELETVCAAAPALLADREPVAALRAWMDRYLGFVRTKRGMMETVAALTATGATTGTRARINEAVATLLSAGARAGELRGDVPADDVTSSMLGVCLATAATGRGEQAGRLLDLLVDGLRPRQHG